MKRYRIWVHLQGHWLLWHSGLAAWQLEVMGVQLSTDVIIEEEMPVTGTTAEQLGVEQRAG